MRTNGWKLFALLLMSLSGIAIAGGDRPAPPDSLVRFSVLRKDTTVVRGAFLNEIPMLPLDVAVAALKGSSFPIDSARTVDVRMPSHTLRFIHKNPFVVVSERISGQASLVQMASAPLWIGGRLYVPLVPFGALLRGIVRDVVSIDPPSTVQVMDSSATTESPFDITGLVVEQRLNGYLMTIKASRQLGAVETWLKPDGWLFVTIENARADTNALRSVATGGAIRQVLVFQSPTSVQLTIKVAPDVSAADVVDDPNSQDLVVTLRTKSPARQQDLDRRRQEMIDKGLAQQRARWKMDVVVIDAGHGGKDPGSIGVSGLYEKKVTLGVALKLRDLLKKAMPDVKVVMTRDNDTFVELYRRTQIANEASGKLFVSIHCNSLDRKPSRPNGFEVYLLRPGRTDEAIRIAARENAVIQLEEDRSRYKQLTEEEFILVTMAQSAYMKHSERFADLTVRSMDKHLTLKNGGVKQAGFYVLVGASMPNVLIETGYLSNKKDEAFLKSTDGQQKMASAILSGIRNFRTEYERDLREGVGSIFPVRDRPSISRRTLP